MEVSAGRFADDVQNRLLGLFDLVLEEDRDEDGGHNEQQEQDADGGEQAFDPLHDSGLLGRGISRTYGCGGKFPALTDAFLRR